MPSRLEYDMRYVNSIFNVDPTNGMGPVYYKLLNLYNKRGIAKLHALLQYIVAAYLYTKGYDVYVEEDVGNGYRADIYAESPWETLIVEVETGYVPSTWHLDLEGYLIGKIVYKTLVYSRFADKFAIAVPSHILVKIPHYLYCKDEDTSLDEIVRLVSSYGFKLPSSIINEVSSPSLNSLFIANIGRGKAEIREHLLNCDKTRLL